MDEKYEAAKKRAEEARVRAETLMMASDTSMASRAYAEAAEALCEVAVLAPGHRSPTLLAAAASYADGGYPSAALHLLNDVRKEDLEPEGQEFFDSLAAESREKLGKDYQAKQEELLADLKKKGEWGEIISLLRKDPYILPPVELATRRAAACLMMGNKEAAEMFVEDARRMKSPIPFV